MPKPSHSIGRITPTAVHDSLIDRTIEFIWNCLLPWRDDPERPFAEAEEELNAQFHNFLQSRAGEHFPMVFFQLEQRQEGRRRVDLSAKPVSSVIIQGATYTPYQPILVIEGKRLPAPSKAREREYVRGSSDVSGGIQRFKLGLHGKEHKTAIILGYLQKGTSQEWHSRINEWISDLAREQPGDWIDDETLSDLQHSNSEGRAKAISVHPRRGECRTSEIRILHLWIPCPSS